MKSRSAIVGVALLMMGLCFGVWILLATGEFHARESNKPPVAQDDRNASGSDQITDDLTPKITISQSPERKSKVLKVVGDIFNQDATMLEAEKRIREELNESDLDLLYEFLHKNCMEFPAAPVVQAICILGDDDRALGNVVSFSTEPYDWSNCYRDGAAYVALNDRVDLVRYIGRMSWPGAIEWLQYATKSANARKLLEKWEPLLNDEFLEFDNAIVALQRTAAYGLLLTGSLDDFRAVEDEFERIAALPPSVRTKEDIDTAMHFAGVLVWRDVVRDRGLEEGLKFTQELRAEHLTLHYIMSNKTKYLDHAKLEITAW
ncbi:MAG: hypothetical protein HYV27_05390 [Candidatus Hydrogenedentes bacterium]|nr:hypothetical protein [Candidatus Hydrogenedentota bacterium]